jgi:hypothetical protein
MFFVGDAINAVGRTYASLGQHRDALATQKKALKFFFRVLPENHPRIGYQLFQIGNTLAHAGDFQQAMIRAAEALCIYQSANLPPSHPHVQSALSLGKLCKQRTSDNVNASKLENTCID